MFGNKYSLFSHNNAFYISHTFSCCRAPELYFVESPALAPPEVQVDLAAQQK